MKSPFNFASPVARKLEIGGVILSAPGLLGLIPGWEWMLAFFAFLSMIGIATLVDVRFRTRTGNRSPGA